MKRNVIYNIIILIFMAYIFINQSMINDVVINSSYIFLSKVLGNITIIYIISNLLINYNFIYYISKIFKGNIFPYIFIMTFFTGAPNNAIMIKDFLSKKLINDKEASICLGASNFINPLFLYSFLSLYLNKINIISIFISLILSNLIIYFKSKIKINCLTKIETTSFSVVLSKSLKSLGSILLNIYLTIILFNIIMLFLPNNLHCFKGILEITNGLNYLSEVNLNNNIKSFLSIIYICFGGLAINTQIKSIIIDTNIDYVYFIKCRLKQIILSLIIYFGIIKFLLLI